MFYITASAKVPVSRTRKLESILTCTLFTRTKSGFCHNFSSEWVYEIQFLGCEVLNFDQATNHLPSSESNWSS